MLLIKNVPEREAIESFLKYSPESEPIAIEAMITMLHVTSEVFSALDTHFSQNNITQGRFHVLMLLARAKEENEEARKNKLKNLPPPITPADIADMLNVTRATITGLLDKLEADKLILRKASKKDRRKQNISITEKASKYLKKFLPEHFKRVGSLMSKLSNKECSTLVKLLEKVKESIPTVTEQ